MMVGSRLKMVNVEYANITVLYLIDGKSDVNFHWNYHQINATEYFWWLVNIVVFSGGLGAVSIRKTVLPGMAIPMLKIRRPNGRLIFNMEIAIRR